MSSRYHVDDSVTLKLKIIKEFSPVKGDFIVKQMDFEKRSFLKKYGKYFKMVPFFQVSDDEIFYAQKCLAQWAEEKYKEQWDKDIIPEEFYRRDGVPVTLRPYWEILYKINQNKWCNFQILDRPIPGHEDIRASIFAGYKAISPFSHDDKQHNIVLTIKGKAKDIDNFIDHYKI